MRYLSVCSGIEAVTVAWSSLGWTPVAFAEHDPERSDGGFAAALLAQRFPDVPNLGDIERHADWKLSGIDVLVGGTPCQAFSVAGLRKGMADPRGNLALVYLAIADQFRPEWLVWENVPGILSSNGGRDFGAFLGGLAQLGYGFAYRVLDAQYFGVPQRRRRVFVVGCARGWQRAAAVLFERASLCGDPAPRRESRASVARSLTASTGGSSAKEQQHTFVAEPRDSVAGALLSNSPGGGFRTGAEEAAAGNHLIALCPEVADPITASEGGTYTHEGKHNFRLHNVVQVAAPLTSGGHPNSNAPGRRKEDDVNVVVSPPLTAGHDGGANAAREESLVVACFDTTQITHRENRSTAAPETAALAKTAHPPAIALRSDASRDGVAKTPSDADGVVRLRDPGFTVEVELAPTLDTSSTSHSVLPPPRNGTFDDGAVRRLTPTECERLQGFEDGWTDVLYHGKPAKDGPRYAALGNSMAVPVVRWIGRRIQDVVDDG